MKRIQNALSQILRDESAQGATEYILLLVIVVGVVMVFKQQIMQMVTDKLTALSSSLQSVTSQ